MFNNNPKELEDYPLTKYRIAYVPKKTEKETAEPIDEEEPVVTIVTIPATYDDNPNPFRCRFKDSNGETQEEITPILGRSAIDIGAVVETRSKKPFRKEDLILEDLELLPFGGSNRFGLRYANYSRVAKVDTKIDEEFNHSNLMFKTKNEEIKELTIG
jgi:hypothetical protein